MINRVYIKLGLLTKYMQLVPGDNVTVYWAAERAVVVRPGVQDHQTEVLRHDVLPVVILDQSSTRRVGKMPDNFGSRGWPRWADCRAVEMNGDALHHFPGGCVLLWNINLKFQIQIVRTLCKQTSSSWLIMNFVNSLIFRMNENNNHFLTRWRLTWLRANVFDNTLHFLNQSKMETGNWNF